MVPGSNGEMLRSILMVPSSDDDHNRKSVIVYIWRKHSSWVDSKQSLQRLRTRERANQWLWMKRKQTGWTYPGLTFLSLFFSPLERPCLKASCFQALGFPMVKYCELFLSPVVLSTQSWPDEVCNMQQEEFVYAIALLSIFVMHCSPPPISMYIGNVCVMSSSKIKFGFNT